MSEQIQHRWPADFDPAECPILALHWLGVEPPHTIGPNAAEARRQRQIHHVHLRLIEAWRP